MQAIMCGATPESKQRKWPEFDLYGPSTKYTTLGKSVAWKGKKSYYGNMAFVPVARYSGAAYPCVPMTLVETWLLSPVGPSLASPKSESLAL